MSIDPQGNQAREALDAAISTLQADASDNVDRAPFTGTYRHGGKPHVNANVEDITLGSDEIETAAAITIYASTQQTSDGFLPGAYTVTVDGDTTTLHLKMIDTDLFITNFGQPPERQFGPGYEKSFDYTVTFDNATNLAATLTDQGDGTAYTRI